MSLLEKHLYNCDPSVLNGRNIYKLTGQQKKREHAEIIAAMNTDPRCIALTTYLVGGVGHNFHSFNNMLLIDYCCNSQVNTLLFLATVI